MGTCVETLISAMKAEPWAGAANMDAPTVVGRRDGLVDELGGVPRPVLQTVFGKDLGRRVWENARRAGSAVADEEIVGGMIAYVSRRAGETLRANRRQAKAIGLRLVYADGAAMLHRMRLARPTCDAGELLAAGMELLEKAETRCAAVASVKLKVTSVHAEAVTEGAAGWASPWRVRRFTRGFEPKKGSPGPSCFRINQSPVAYREMGWRRWLRPWRDSSR